jgi:hypothetical protein
MTDAKRAAMIDEVEALPPGRFVPVQTLAHAFTREELLAMLGSTAANAKLWPEVDRLLLSDNATLRAEVQRLEGELAACRMENKS